MLAAAVESAVTQSYGSFEVLVVDQSRSTQTAQIVHAFATRYPQVRYLPMEGTGAARARNYGVRHAFGEIVAFADDDCVLPPTWLAVFAQSFAKEADVDLIYGQVLLPAHLRLRDGVEGITPWLPISRRRRLNRREGFQVFGMSANCAARRSTFGQLSGFDELLGVGAPLRGSEDFDFAYRLFRAGGTILLEPGSIVYHYGFRSHADWHRTLIGYGIGQGGFYFKHVRSGDLYAIWLLASVLGIEAARLVKRVIDFRRPGEKWAYLQGIFTGIGQSLRYGVDRQRRLYYVRGRGGSEAG